MKPLNRILACSSALAGLLLANPAAAIDLANCGTAVVPLPCPYVTYGDGNSYSLPVNAFLHDIIAGGGVGPGNPYYVDSTPGAIKDLTVVATGASGSPVNTNYAGADDAYATPNGTGGGDFFRTGFTSGDPNGAGNFTGDGATTWDVTLSALKGFMGSSGGNSVVFYFNNNQVNSGAATNQNLAVWAQLSVTGPSGILQIFDFTNHGAKFATVADGGGGVLYGSPGAYTHSGGLSSPLAGTNAATDYVLSGGELCYSAPPAFALVPCSGPHAGSINHNLGANQAAYAVVFPELDSLLMGLGSSVAGYSLNIDFRFGCDPATADPLVDCVGRSQNNGYEQLFIGTQIVPEIPVSTPPSLLLMGLGLLGLGGLGKARRTRRAA